MTRYHRLLSSAKQDILSYVGTCGPPQTNHHPIKFVALENSIKNTPLVTFTGEAHQPWRHSQNLAHGSEETRQRPMARPHSHMDSIHLCIHNVLFAADY